MKPKLITKKCIECDSLFEYASTQGQSRRKFCTTSCRNRYTNRKAYRNMAKTDRNKHAKAKARAFEHGKNMCIICAESGIEAWYHRVGSHVFLQHGMLAKDYRRKYDMDTVKGMLSPKLLKVYQANNKANYDIVVGKNLIKSGSDTRFRKGQAGLGKYHRSKDTMRRLKQTNFTKKKI